MWHISFITTIFTIIKLTFICFERFSNILATVYITNRLHLIMRCVYNIKTDNLPSHFTNRSLSKDRYLHHIINRSITKQVKYKEYLDSMKDAPAAAEDIGDNLLTCTVPAALCTIVEGVVRGGEQAWTLTGAKPICLLLLSKITWKPRITESPTTLNDARESPLEAGTFIIKDTIAGLITRMLTLLYIYNE